MVKLTMKKVVPLKADMSLFLTLFIRGKKAKNRRGGAIRFVSIVTICIDYQIVHTRAGLHGRF